VTSTPLSIESKSRASSRRRFDVSDAANIVLFLTAFVGMWQLIFMLKIWPVYLMPSPAIVVTEISALIVNYSLPIGIGTTLARLAAGFIISLGFGVGVGLAMVKFRGFGKTMSSFAAGLLTFPSIGWVPFAIIFFGFNDFGILFVIVMASVFSVMITTYSSIRNIPPLYLRSARNMGASGFSLFQHVMIPAATPSLILGIRQAWSFAWHALIGAEMLITTLYGLGHILMVGREFNSMQTIIATMITIFAIGIVFDRVVFRKLEERVRSRWGLDQQSH